MKVLDLRKFCLIFLSLLLIFFDIQAQSEAWTKKKDLPTRRGCASACVINDKIYIIGGTSGAPGYPNLADNEMYDPISNTWTIKEHMPTPRMFLATAVLNNNIYAIGGGYPDNKSILEVYDPDTNTWRTETNMPVSNMEMQACVVKEIIYVVGGAYDKRYCWAYDPVTKEWTKKQERPEHGGALAVCVYNNLIYTFGASVTPFGPVYGIVYVYNPETDEWFKKKNMPTARFGFQTFLWNGKIYAMGGSQSRPGSLSTVEVYDPLTDTWEQKPDMPFRGVYLSGGVVNNKIYIAAGTPDWATGGSAFWEYDPSFSDEPTEIDESLFPENFMLYQNYPNPFNPVTIINYKIPTISYVTLKVYDILGNEIAVPLNEERFPGNYEIEFNAKNLPAGSYFYQLKADQFIETRKMLLIK